MKSPSATGLIFVEALTALLILVTFGVSVSPVETPTDTEAARGQASSMASPTAATTIDYPEDESIFPPEITPPTFIWHDGEKTATVWRIDISFADGSAAIHAISHGERMRIGTIDPRCVSETNELPKLTPQQEAARTWTPAVATWGAIKKHSVAGPATVTITGFGSEKLDHMVSRGHVAIHTSRDPVGADGKTRHHQRAG